MSYFGIGLGLGGPPSLRFGPHIGSGFSPAASDYFRRLDLAGLRVNTYDAANARLIDRLVANGGNFWPDSGAFNAMAGYLFPTGGTLIPLKDGHDAGTLNAFVSGDWNAVTGLKGDGVGKYVDSNRNNNADGRNDQAMGVYCTEAVDTAGSFRIWMGSGTVDGSSSLNFRFTEGSSYSVRSRSGTGLSPSPQLPTAGFFSISRSNSGNFLAVVNSNAPVLLERTSQAPTADPIFVFSDSILSSFCPSRFPFYHIGPNLSGTGELAELDAILTDWQTDLANA